MKKDKIEKVGNSIIQHGKENNRIYLMKLDENDVPDIISSLNDLAETKKYSKIFAKVPKYQEKLFLEDGYKEEAVIPDFFNGKIDCAFLGKFLSNEREINLKEAEIENVLRIAKNKSSLSGDKKKKDLFQIRKAGSADIVFMSRIYKEVFKSYPFPIDDPQYLLDTMKSHIDYFVVCYEGNIVAVSSAEKDLESKNSEMTDFATLPEYRGKGLASRLLQFMGMNVTNEGVKTGYTIARALSFGMNITFAKNGYIFAGTLINNTNIAGAIENMNVWYKSFDSMEWLSSPL